MFIKNTYSQIEFIKPLINYKLEIAYQNYIFTQKPNYYVRDAQVKVMATYKNDFTPAGTLPATTKLTVNDFHIYGSSRLGKKGVDEILYSVNIPTSPTIIDRSARFLGTKRYELSNHLGNVLEVISDRKLCVDDGGGNVDYYTADVVSYSDYYPFGMLMPNRHGQDDDYRYGFNGMEKDDEVRGTKGASYDFGARMLDPRIGRWLSADAAEKLYPALSSYAFSMNNSINYNDLDGNIVRDAQGNIVFVKLGSTTSEHGGAPGVKFKTDYGYIFADDGTKILVFKSTDVGEKHEQFKSDCHGSSFADGEYWINNDQAPILLEHDNYDEVDFSQRKEGDKVIYTSTGDNVEDSRTVTKDKNKVKGQGGLEKKDYESGIYVTWNDPFVDKKARIFRKTKKDKVYTKAQIDKLKRDNTTLDNNVANRSDKLSPNSNAKTIPKTNIYTFKVDDKSSKTMDNRGAGGHSAKLP